MLRLLTLVLLITVRISATGPTPEARSPDLVKQLTTALVEYRLEAVAAQHPEEPDRFVAALFFPGAQLLVISARHTIPEASRARLAQKQYRDIYLDLSSATDSASSWLLQDMQADGLCASREQVADVLYNETAPPMIFDADWKKRGLSEADYMRLFAEADERYSRLLHILLQQLGRK